RAHLDGTCLGVDCIGDARDAPSEHLVGISGKCDIDALTDLDQADRAFRNVGRDPDRAEIGDRHQRRVGVVTVLARGHVQLEHFARNRRPYRHALSELARFQAEHFDTPAILFPHRLRLFYRRLRLREAVFGIDDLFFGDRVVFEKVRGAVVVRLRLGQIGVRLRQRGSGLQIRGFNSIHVRTFQREHRLTFFDRVTELHQDTLDPAWRGQHDPRYSARIGLDFARRGYLICGYLRGPDRFYSKLLQLWRVGRDDDHARG